MKDNMHLFSDVIKNFWEEHKHTFPYTMMIDTIKYPCERCGKKVDVARATKFEDGIFHFACHECREKILKEE
jgi:DNA-directed RNA polymerase subunit RPC12/RpoP